MSVYLGTRSGVYRLDAEDEPPTPLGLDRQRIWAIHAWPNGDGTESVVAGSYGEGIFRSADSGASWLPANTGLNAYAIRTLQPDPCDPRAILCGTEPARGFRSIDGGLSWVELEAIATLSGVTDWFLPYSPRAGALRNFYAPPGRSGDLYGSVEVGGLLHSADGGDSWRLIEVDPGPRVHDDVHFVCGDPAHAETLYVTLGGALVDRTHGQWIGDGPRRIGGVARSDDGGASWRKLLPDYTRGVVIPSRRPDLLLAGPAQRTNEGGGIVCSGDGGETWVDASDGIVTPMADMVERFEEAPDGSIWALCSGGSVFTAEPGVWQWSSPLPGDAVDIIVESVSFVAE